MRWTTLVAAASLACASACSQAADATRSPSKNSPAQKVQPAQTRTIEGLETGERFYGVYMKDNKVGWMRQKSTVGKTVELETEMYAEILGMGSVQKVQLDETRSYSSDGELRTLSFEQAAATGSTRIDGQVRGNELHLTVTAGGSASQQRVPVKETLEDSLAPSKLAVSGKLGAAVTSSRFDASIQKQITTHYTIIAREKRNFAGVETVTLKIESDTPELGVKETAWYDQRGIMLESRIGGFFKASLESPEVAKKLDYREDFIKGGVVRPPNPIVNPTGLESLQLDLRGLDSKLPETPRQRVVFAKERTRVQLSRDALPRQKWSLGSSSSVSADLRSYLQATPFLQSKDPQIIAAAKRVVGDAKDIATVNERLTHFVYQAIRDEYVPAYSNAKEAFSSGRGDCTEHAVLFVAMARALGIPARVAVGLAYWPPGDGFGWHAWAEIHADGNWIAVDPTWDQPIADATHLKLAGGGPAEQTRVVMMMGEVEIVSLDEG